MDQAICKRAVLAAVTAMAKDSRLPKAKVSAIRVFLRGIDSTPYKDAYALYSDIWGSLPRVSKAEPDLSPSPLLGTNWAWAALLPRGDWAQRKAWVPRQESRARSGRP